MTLETLQNPEEFKEFWVLTTSEDARKALLSMVKDLTIEQLINFFKDGKDHNELAG